MARTNSLSNFLTDVAAAIKQKKGDDTDIIASEFDTEIANLPSQGGSSEDATATADDILYPKTAYAKGEKITGRIMTESSSSANLVEASGPVMISSSYRTIGFTPDGNYAVSLNYTDQTLDLYQVQDTVFTLLKQVPITTFRDVTASYVGYNSVSLSGYGASEDNDCVYCFVAIGNYKGFITVLNLKTLEFNYSVNDYNGEYDFPEDWNIGVIATKICFSSVEPRLFASFNHDGNNYKRYVGGFIDKTSVNYAFLKGGHEGNGNFMQMISTTNNGKVFQFLLNTTSGSNYNNAGVTFVKKLGYVSDTLNSINFNNTAIDYIFSPSGNYATDGKAVYSSTFSSSSYTITKLFDLSTTYNAMYFLADNTFIAMPNNTTIQFIIFNVSDSTYTVNSYTLLSTLTQASVLLLNNAYWHVGSSLEKYKITFSEIIEKITIGPNVLFNTTESTATNSEILSGKITYGNNGKIIGTMPNNGTLSYTPSDSQQTIPAGYTSGGTISAMDITISEEYQNCLELSDQILE